MSAGSRPFVIGSSVIMMVAAVMHGEHFSLSASEVPNPLDCHVSFEFIDAPLSEALAALCKPAGLTCEMSKEAELLANESVEISFRGMVLESALWRLLRR